MRRSLSRRRFLSLSAVAPTVAGGGCLGPVRPDEVDGDVSVETDAVAVASTDHWAAGGTLRAYDSLVVAGELTNVADGAIEAPTVRVRWFGAAGELGTTTAEYDGPAGRSADDDRIDPGETRSFRAVFDPGDEAIDRYELTVSDAAAVRR